MTENTRDTQFAGFAKLLWNEMMNNGVLDGEQIIARRAYDLVKHVCEIHDCEGNFGIMSSDDMIRIMPDLTEWPEVQE